MNPSNIIYLLRLLHRFIARLAEAYQVLLAKKSICRSKASTF